MKRPTKIILEMKKVNKPNKKLRGKQQSRSYGKQNKAKDELLSQCQY